MVVLANEASQKNAVEFIQHFVSITPFNQLIQAGALTVASEPKIYNDQVLRCRGGLAGIARLAQCDVQDQQTYDSLIAGADIYPIFTDVPSIGAGGSRPISSSTFPWTTMLHEVTHGFGFGDDYAYTQSESPLYCSSSWVNDVMATTPEPSYKTEQEATNFCMQNIPWCAQAMAMGSQVMSQQVDGTYVLGTPTPKSCPSDQLGVYAGGNCQVDGPTWRPHFCPTVMGYPAIGQDHCTVDQRHLILSKAPNLLPFYYQQTIIAWFAKETGMPLTDVKPATFDASSYAEFIYGIPEVDQLGHPGSTLNLCSPTFKPDFATDI
jgi:hypothetical protein